MNLFCIKFILAGAVLQIMADAVSSYSVCIVCISELSAYLNYLYIWIICSSELSAYLNYLQFWIIFISELSAYLHCLHICLVCISALSVSLHCLYIYISTLPAFWIWGKNDIWWPPLTKIGKYLKCRHFWDCFTHSDYKNRT